MQQGVQFGEPVAAIYRANIEGEITDVSIRRRQRRRAQKQARRKVLDGAAHHAIGILRLDLAIDLEAQLGERAVGCENMGDVAERVFVRIEPASAETSMRQPTTYWPSWLRGVIRNTCITPAAADRNDGRYCGRCVGA